MRYSEHFARLASLIVVVAIGAAAAFEAAVALQWIPLGTEPGEGADFEGPFMAVGVLASLVGVVLAVLFAVRRARIPLAAPFAGTAAAFMVAHYYTFDTYYLPTLTRYSDSGSFSPAWVYSVALAGLLASLLSLAQPPTGYVLTAVVIFFCMFTVVFTGFGH